MVANALAGQTVLITGGHRRLGLGIANHLAGLGANIAFTFFSDDAAAKEAQAGLENLGAATLALRADLRDISRLQEVVAATLERFGAIDALINNAAVFPKTKLNEITPASFDDIVNINLRAPFFLAQKVGQHMCAADGGTIINLVDALVDRPFSDYIPYCATKAALANMTRSLAKALAPKVRVHAVHPGWILPAEDTDPETVKRAVDRIPLGRVGNVSDVATLVSYLLRHGSYATGGSFFVDGGIHIT